MAYRTVRDVLMFYREQGNGRPVVLIHGFPLDSRMYDDQIAALSNHARVIVPDLPGFGRSKSDKPCTIASLADDVHELLKSMNALPCVLGGLSMGGYIALAFAKKYPRDLSALILMDTRAEGDTSEGKATRDKTIELVRKSGATAVADQMLPKLVAAQTQESKPAVVSKLREIIEKCPPLTIEHALVALRDREDYSGILASIQSPTLIIVGEHDALTPPKMSQAMHEKILGSKLVQIPGAGHMSTMENPEAVNRAIEQFLSI